MIINPNVVACLKASYLVNDTHNVLSSRMLSNRFAGNVVRLLLLKVLKQTQKKTLMSFYTYAWLHKKVSLKETH